MSIFCLFLQKTVMRDKPTYYLNLQLFVYSEFIVPLENFSLIWIRHQCQWRAANFDLCSALMAIEQWGFLNVQHLQWHRTSVYNGHLRGLVTLTPVAEHLAVELSLTYGCRDRDSNTQPSPCRANTVTDYATAVVIIFITTFTSLLLNKCFCEIE